jgi:hypothetical protein
LPQFRTSAEVVPSAGTDPAARQDAFDLVPKFVARFLGNKIDCAAILRSVSGRDTSLIPRSLRAEPCPAGPDQIAVRHQCDCLHLRAEAV